MSTFLILGASSFYGSNFAKLVKEMGDEAICLSRPTWALGGPIEDEGDYVVNFASQSLVAESWKAPEKWLHANGCETALTLQRLIGHDFRKFIHVSTPEVYGSTPLWVDEDWPYNPTTPYAVSRAAGDMMVKAYHKAYWFPAIITRTANIYGPGQPDYRIIPKAIALKKEGKTLPLHGGGDSVRSFIHVRDACEATYLIAKQGKVGETYHISTKKAHSIRKVVEMIGCAYTSVTDRLGKDHAYKLNSGKIRNLGWRDTISLEEGLCELSR